MNQLINFEFSEFSLLTVLLTGILLAFLLKIINKIFIAKRKNEIRQFFQLLEILIWVIYSFWGLHVVLKDSYYYMLAVLSICAVILIWIAWFVARDFIAGIVLKLSSNYQPGQNFMLDTIQGKIIEVSFLHLTILQEDGNRVKIPYSKISGSVRFESPDDNMSSQQRFELMVKNNQTMDEISNSIRRIILLTPGTSINKEPQIILKDNDGNSLKFEITFNVISNQFAQEVIEKLKKQFVFS